MTDDDEVTPVPALEFRVKWAAVANEVGRLSRLGGAPVLTAYSDANAIANWLQWNDPNGSHSAAWAERDGFDPYDLGTAWDVLATMLADEEDLCPA